MTAASSFSTTSAPPQSRRTHWHWGQRILFHGLLLVGVVVVCLPLFWMISASLKPPKEIFTVPVQWLPTEIRWQNYVDAWNTAPFARYFFNSVYVAGMTTGLNLFFCSLAGYGFAKYHFPGKNILFIFVLATLMIPFHVVMIPLWMMMRDFKWLDSFSAVIIPGMMSSFGIFLMRQYIQTLPNDLFEAARIDGAGEIYCYQHIVLPLSKAPLAALAVFVFLDSWNSLLWPLVVVKSEEIRTLTLGLSAFSSQYSTSYHLLMAASTIIILPMIGLFFLLQRYFIQGVTLSGIKG